MPELIMDTYIYSSRQIRTIEAQLFATGMASSALMTRAGEQAFAVLSQQWPTATRIIVLCGSGNNGGDGYVVARLAQRAGYQAQVFYSALPKTPDAQLMKQQAEQAGVVIEPWSEKRLMADVLVDALLGIGLNNTVTGVLAQMIAAINRSLLPVLAIDVPSGIDADTGAVQGVAVQASYSVCFIGYKLGLLTGDGASYAGQVILKSLDIANHFYPDPIASIFRQERLQFAKRARNCHKGDFGHVLMIGGDDGMGGAVMMAAEAALRSGAGRVTVATHPNHVNALLSRCPEVMVKGVQHPLELQPLLSSATVVVIGMGLGRQAWGQRLWLAVQNTNKPLLVDADGLYWLAQQPDKRTNRVLTPHAGEAARLLAKDNSDDIQQQRLVSVQQLVDIYGGVVLLKGAGSLTANEQSVYLCPYGNAGMATAGMGDTLAGIMGGLIAQFGLTLETVTKSVVAHALAGDKAAEAGERGLMATDLLVPLRSVLNSAS